MMRTMSDSDWYEVAQGSSLFQGDILKQCPVFVVEGELTLPLREDADIGVRVKIIDLVVLTQSCDLENDKVEDILLAQLLTWTDVVSIEVARGNGTVKGKDFRKALVAGNVPGLSLLHKRIQEPQLDWSVVDFHRLYTLPKKLVLDLASKMGRRLRLRPPYREHLAQAFARYFMRVGLPHDAKDFIKEGKVN